MDICIISIAQQASPNVIHISEPVRARVMRLSALVSRKLLSASSRVSPVTNGSSARTSLPLRGPKLSRAVGMLEVLNCSFIGRKLSRSLPAPAAAAQYRSQPALRWGTHGLGAGSAMNQKIGPVSLQATRRASVPGGTWRLQPCASPRAVHMLCAAGPRQAHFSARGSVPAASAVMATPIADNDVLLVVDVQNDFCPSGQLPVPHGDDVVPIINRLAR